MKTQCFPQYHPKVCAILQPVWIVISGSTTQMPLKLETKIQTQGIWIMLLWGAWGKVGLVFCGYTSQVSVKPSRFSQSSSIWRFQRIINIMALCTLHITVILNVLTLLYLEAISEIIISSPTGSDISHQLTNGGACRYPTFLWPNYIHTWEDSIVSSSWDFLLLVT